MTLLPFYALNIAHGLSAKSDTVSLEVLICFGRVPVSRCSRKERGSKPSWVAAAVGSGIVHGDWSGFPLCPGYRVDYE